MAADPFVFAPVRGVRPTSARSLPSAIHQHGCCSSSIVGPPLHLLAAVVTMPPPVFLPGLTPFLHARGVGVELRLMLRRQCGTYLRTRSVTNSPDLNALRIGQSNARERSVTATTAHLVTIAISIVRPAPVQRPVSTRLVPACHGASTCDAVRRRALRLEERCCTNE